MVDIYEKEGLDRQVVADWFKKEFPTFQYNEVLAAQMYLRNQVGKEPDLTDYVRVVVIPLSETQQEVRANVRVLLTGIVERTERQYDGCPHCWKKVEQTLGVWQCKEHGQVEKPVMRYSADMMGNDGTVPDLMRFSFLPWSIARSLESGMIQDYKEIIGVPVTLGVVYTDEEKFDVHEIIIVGGENSHDSTGVPGLKVDTVAPKPAPVAKPAPEPAPAVQPAATPAAQPAAVTPAPATPGVIVPPEVIQKGASLLELFKSEGGLTYEKFAEWITTLHGAQAQLPPEAVIAAIPKAKLENGMVALSE